MKTDAEYGCERFQDGAHEYAAYLETPKAGCAPTWPMRTCKSLSAGRRPVGLCGLWTSDGAPEPSQYAWLGWAFT